MTADVLQTVQINGVVWAQVISGNTVFVTGKFTRARPAGAAPGSQETTRSNALAYDIDSGNLLPWNPNLNSQGLAIEVSGDGQTVFLAGDFTSVGGASRSRIAAVNATSGAVISGWSANANSRVKGLSVEGNDLYVGGNFTSISGNARTRLAKLAVSNGAVNSSWKPSSDREVQDVTAPAGTGVVVAAGSMEKLNGTTARGMGAVNASNGSTRDWKVNQIIQNYGPNSAILSLSNDGSQVYGSGYDFYGPSKFEGTFAAKTSDGTMVWLNSCRGDTYDEAPVGNVLYSVGHAHDCQSIGGNPEISPRTYQRALATTTFASGTNYRGNFPNKPKPRLLAWTPDLQAGNYTGKWQAAWTVKGNSKYVVIGGEFPSVNGVKQQGLARFAISSAAPNKEGPRSDSGLKPTLSENSSGTVTAKWKGTYDRDNRNLTYEVLRGSTVAATVKADSAWWSLPALDAEDNGSPKGQQTYRIRVSDAFGNSVLGATTTITVKKGGSGATNPPATDPQPPAPEPPANPTGSLAVSDSFGRTVSNGLGSADQGGAWAINGTSSRFKVDGSAAVLTSTAKGQQNEAWLSGATAAAVDLRVKVAADANASGGGMAVVVAGRRVDAANHYDARLLWASGNKWYVSLIASRGSTSTSYLSPQVQIPGTFQAGSKVNLRLQVSGTGTTTIRVKAWADGASEPGSWTIERTDSYAGLQKAGYVGFLTYLSGSATTVPIGARFSGLSTSPV